MWALHWSHEISSNSRNDCSEKQHRTKDYPETANDLTSNANHGTLTDGAGTGTPNWTGATTDQNTPLSVPAIRNSMNRAFVRCGLSDRFCNTHVLRRTMATRLQRSGASVKDIADFLRHQSLDTARTYARVDVEQLRAVALPWPGSSQ